MKRAWLYAVAAVAVLAAGEARGQTVRAGDLELDFTGRLQVQMNTTSVTDEDLIGVEEPAGVVLETRRVRFGANIAFEDWLTGKVEVDYGGGSAALTDGYVDAAMSDAVAVRMGQFKVPFGLFELTSNTKILTIERSVRIRGLEELVGVPGETHWLLDDGGFLGRQIGVMVHGTTGDVGYAAGVFNGEGANVRESRGSKAFAARATFGLSESLVLGGAVSDQPTGELDVAGDEIRATAFAVDAEWGAFRGEGLHVMAEAMVGENPVLIAADEAPTMMGLQVAAGWFSPREGRIEGIEPVFRLSWADPDTDIDNNEGTLVTPGVNLYFTGRNRFMVNVDTYLPAADGLDPEFSLIAQFQVYF
ncbi:MAG: porin [Candidatus Longimicrobiales bacterium M2_2A_002]